MSFGLYERLAVDLAEALHTDEAVSAVITDRAFDAGVDGEFLGREELSACSIRAVDDPAVHVALAERVSATGTGSR